MQDNFQDTGSGRFFRRSKNLWSLRNNYCQKHDDLIAQSDPKKISTPSRKYDMTQYPTHPTLYPDKIIGYTL